MQQHSSTRPKARFFYGWVIVANGFFVEMVVMGTALYAYSVFLLPLSRTFNTGVFDVLLGLTCLNISVALLSPLAGHLIARGSIKHYMVLGLALLGAGFYLISQATALWQIILLYGLLIGFGYAFIAPIAASAVITNWFTAQRGRALSLAAIGTSFGGLVISPIAAWLVTSYDWRTAYQGFALLYFLVAIPVVWLLVVNHPRDKGLVADGGLVEESTVNCPETEAKKKVLSTREVLRCGDFWRIAIAIGAAFAVFMAMTANLISYATTLGITEQKAALFLSLLTGCGILGKLFFAAVTDRIGLRSTFWCALALDLIAMILLVNMPVYSAFVVATVCVGLSSGGMLPLWAGFIGLKFDRDSMAKVMGLMAPIVNGAMMLAPPFAGWIFDTYGDYRAAFGFFIVVLMISLFASRRLGGHVIEPLLSGN